MTGYHLLLFQLIVLLNLNAAICTFFHKSSYIDIEPPETGTDFGLTLEYFSEMQSLVVGAPFSDQNGKLYLCPLNDNALLNRKTACTRIPIDIDRLVQNHSRSHSPNQRFGLGASISVTPEYIFTCAPLVTFDITLWNGTKFGACGTCFKYNGESTMRYLGLMEQYEKDMNTNNSRYSSIDINNAYGGVGWSTFADVEQRVIIIAKPSGLHSTLHYIDMDQPSNPPQLVQDGINMDTIKNAYLAFNYKGTAFAAGMFFKGYRTLYAFSYEDRKVGFISFLTYNNTTKKMDLLTVGKSGKESFVQINDISVGSMFGYSMHSTNFDRDGYTDLLVGAPGYGSSDENYENGAVHIYLGGDLRGKDRPQLKTLRINSMKDGSRFGTSIATADLDGDSYPEIFVSAPFENSSKGAVYIISGYEVNQIFNKNNKIYLSDLLNVQRIQNEKIDTLGFSLKALPVPHFDELGLYFLAMGSPDSGKVALYRSIPIITVNLKTKLRGSDVNIVREQDTECIVTVTVEVIYPKNPTLITGKLLVNTSIVGDAVWLKNGTNYEIILSEVSTSSDGIPASHSTDIVVSFQNWKPGFYLFKAEVRPDIENLNREDFDPSLVDISVSSNTTSELGLMRECEGEDCVANLSLTFEWSGGNKDLYTPGENDTETMTVVIRNDGGATFGSCARIKITGAQIALLECKTDDGWYKCDLMNIGRYTEYSLPILLDMSKPTNQHDNLRIEVLLYNKCTSHPNKENYTKIINYDFMTDGIYFNSTHYKHVITDLQIEDVDSSRYIEIIESYTITNKAEMFWSSLPLEIYLEEQPFITDYLIQVESIDCNKTISDRTYYICPVDLKPDSTITVKSNVTIIKDKVVKSLKNKKLELITYFKLYMKPTSNTNEDMYTTDIEYQKTIGLENNKFIVIAISILVGIFVMAVIAIILSKGGFFKRAEKEKLVSLKHDIRKQSIRRPIIEYGQDASAPNLDQLENCGTAPINSESSFQSSIVGVTQRKNIPAT
ncbi:integrin alpha-9 [Bicyclus anynana]|uniref:Integrin alpha-9 n=1 Tax=Bicyclus anynana TaxID=110368 RepID=A0A6J1MSA0_BICAN|nr:integrin alpha-9 [Bicyclus anynana]